MKTLLVLRHAKSSWSDPDLADHDRPLKKRGRRAAPRMGRLVKAEGLTPEIIVSSTARRARDTALAVADAAEFKGVVHLDPRLYECEPENVIEVLREFPHDRIMIVGHNPTFELLVQWLTGQETRLPTAALAHVQLPVSDWTECRLDKSAKLVEVWRPRELPEDD